MAAPGKKEGRTTRLRSQIVSALKLCQGELPNSLYVELCKLWMDIEQFRYLYCFYMISLTISEQHRVILIVSLLNLCQTSLDASTRKH